MKKGTWKRRSISADSIREAIRTSRSFSEAARSLGVDRSTLHRWREADPSLKDVPFEGGAATAEALTVPANLEPDHWAQCVRATYELSATEEALLDLARRALTIARNPAARPADQLAAAGRFQRLVIQLDLEKPVGKATDRPRLYAVR